MDENLFARLTVAPPPDPARDRRDAVAAEMALLHGVGDGDAWAYVTDRFGWAS